MGLFAGDPFFAGDGEALFGEVGGDAAFFIGDGFFVGDDSGESDIHDFGTGGDALPLATVFAGTVNTMMATAVSLGRQS